jgi:two-component sensor histidine kinase
VTSSRAERQWVREQMERFALPDCETATLVATELVDNAIQHARSSCKLRLELHPAGLSIAVSDHDPRPPVLHSRDVAAGRAQFGIVLIEMLSRAWGCSPRWDGGKVVWAVLPVAGWPSSPIDPPSLGWSSLEQ